MNRSKFFLQAVPSLAHPDGAKLGMRSLLLLAAAPAARAILSDACQIALGEDDFFEAFKASKVAVHFNASNAACEHAKRSSVNDFLGG